MLSTDLLERLRARAADATGRSDAPDSAPERSYFGGALKLVRGSLGAPEAPAPLAAPASRDAVAAAEAQLGVALPADLKQLYAGVADGGFGPAGGLAPLAQLVARHRDLMAEPPGEGGQLWPEHLLPIGLAEPGADCYDLKTGAIVYWDEEALAEGPSDAVWARSFRTAADSLATWLEDWLAAPPMALRLEQNMEQVLLDGLKQSLAHWRAMSPEERAAMGLPEEDWEQELFGHLGVDLKGL